MFRRIIAKFFWDSYDYLGRLLVANIIFFLIILGLSAVFYTLFYPVYKALGSSGWLICLGVGTIAVVSLPFPASGFLYFFTRISLNKEPEFRDFLTGLRIHYKSLVKITFAFVVLLELLLINILFYIHSPFTSPILKMVSLVFCGICVWIMLYLCAMMLYAYPLVIHQGVGIKKVFFRSFVLVLDNMGITAYCIMLGLGIITLGLITKGMAFFVINMALLASLSNSLYENIMEKYEILEAGKQNSKETNKPSSWKQLKTRDFIEDRHKRYKRTLKDILKPWEY